MAYPFVTLPVIANTIKELSSFDVKAKIVKEPLPTIEHLPGFSAVIAKATEKKPQKRYLSCGQFNQALILALQSPGSMQSGKKENPSKIVKLLIGRSYDANLIINEPYISRKHAILFIDVGQKEFTIEDLNSTSGTYVNGKKIYSKIKLKKGYKVYLGNYQLNWEDYVAKVLEDEAVEIENDDTLNSGTTTHTTGNSLWDNYVRAMSKYADFNGRAGAREYWSFVLFAFLFFLAGAMIIASANHTDLQHADIATRNKIMNYYLLVGLVHFLPGLAVTVRRMHDTNNSGWFMLVPIYNIILTVMESDNGPNKYGNKN